MALRYRKKLIVASHKTISPVFLDKLVYVYNGKLYQNFVVKRNMIGLKFGEFIVTKRIGSSMHYFGRKKKVGAKSGRRK
jgi:ribosomal protein S19